MIGGILGAVVGLALWGLDLTDGWWVLWLGLAGIAWVCAALCVAMLGATTYLGRAFEARRRDESAVRSSPS